MRDPLPNILPDDKPPQRAFEMDNEPQKVKIVGKVDTSFSFMRAALEDISCMIANCAGVPTEPDSLPQMIKAHSDAAIAKGAALQEDATIQALEAGYRDPDRMREDRDELRRMARND